MMFSQFFLSLLVDGALALTAVSAISLIALLIKDYKKGRIW